MGFLRSTKGIIYSTSFKAMHDLGPIETGNLVTVSLFDDHLTLAIPAGKHEPIRLQYSQITDVYHGWQSEIVEKDRSVIGRAVAGGLLFGGIGAVVGGMSGVGRTKTVKESTQLLIISYTSKDGEDAFLQFEDTQINKGKKLAAQLKELCGIEEQPEEAEEITEL